MLTIVSIYLCPWLKGRISVTYTKTKDYNTFLGSYSLEPISSLTVATTACMPFCVILAYVKLTVMC